jgi:hypothetical protein
MDELDEEEKKRRRAKRSGAELETYTPPKNETYHDGAMPPEPQAGQILVNTTDPDSIGLIMTAAEEPLTLALLRADAGNVIRYDLPDQPSAEFLVYAFVACDITRDYAQVLAHRDGVEMTCNEVEDGVARAFYERFVPAVARPLPEEAASRFYDELIDHGILTAGTQENAPTFQPDKIPDFIGAVASQAKNAAERSTTAVSDRVEAFLKAESEQRRGGATTPEVADHAPAPHPYLDEIIQGITEGSAPNAPRWPSRELGAHGSLHYDLARDLAALPAQTDKPPYPAGAGGLIDPYKIADWIVNPANAAAVKAWSDSPVAAAKLRDATPQGHDAAPADIPKNRDKPLASLSLSVADLENPWNAVVMPLPHDADPLVRAGSLHAACYCAVGEYQLMREVRNGDYIPPYYDPSHPDEIGKHEYAESRWQQAEKRVNELLLFEYRDLATLQAAESVYSEIAEQRGVDLDNPANAALLYRWQSVGELEGFFEEREEALQAIRQNAESQQQGDGLTPPEVADLAPTETRTGDRVEAFLKAESEQREQAKQEFGKALGKELTEEQGEEIARDQGGGFSIS